MQPHRSITLSGRRVYQVARALAASAAIALASGCTAPIAQVVVKLEISEIGTYSVDGNSVDRAALTAALIAKRQSGKQLLVHVVASSKANYEAVELAVKAAQDSGATVGMVGNAQF